jgi:hypothetical protein
MSTPPPREFKSEQYEFNAEQNRTFNELAAAMEVVATLMKILGLLFLIFFGLLLLQAAQVGGGYGPVIGLGSAMLVCLAIGFWTASSARSFRRIVESQNRDIWHLMNALGSLRAMYSLLRTIVIASLVLLLIGLALFAFDRFSKG